MNYIVHIQDETGHVEKVESDGVIVLYLEQGKVQIRGKIDMATLAPMLTKLFLEKMVK